MQAGARGRLQVKGSVAKSGGNKRLRAETSQARPQQATNGTAKPPVPQQQRQQEQPTGAMALKVDTDKRADCRKEGTPSVEPKKSGASEIASSSEGLVVAPGSGSNFPTTDSGDTKAAGASGGDANGSQELFASSSGEVASPADGREELLPVRDGTTTRLQSRNAEANQPTGPADSAGGIGGEASHSVVNLIGPHDPPKAEVAAGKNSSASICCADEASRVEDVSALSSGQTVDCDPEEAGGGGQGHEGEADAVRAKNSAWYRGGR